jgi:hypothetical protein
LKEARKRLDGCRHEARLEGDVFLPKTVNGGSVTQFDKRRHLLCHSPFVDLCQNSQKYVD